MKDREEMTGTRCTEGRPSGHKEESPGAGVASPSSEIFKTQMGKAKSSPMELCG